MIPSMPLAPRFTEIERGNEPLLGVVGYKKNSPSLTGIELDKKSDIGDCSEVASLKTSDMAIITCGSVRVTPSSMSIPPF